MLEVLFALAIFGDGVTLTDQLVLVSGGAFETHGAARVELAVADAYFGAETVTEAVGKSRRGVMKNAGGIDFVHEAAGGVGIFWDDRGGGRRGGALCGGGG